MEPKAQSLALPLEDEMDIKLGECHCGCGGKTGIAASTCKRLGHVKGQPQRFVNGHNKYTLSAKSIAASGVPYGYCHCRCGRKTKIAKNTNNRAGHRAGEPVRYIPGHHGKQNRPEIIQPTDPSKRRIALTQGQAATVNAHIYEWLMESNWSARWNKSTKSYYALRDEYSPARRTVLMHREILGLKVGDKRKGDHQNHDTLDNTGQNLRRANDVESARNTRYKGGLSGFKGVIRDGDKWLAIIVLDKKRVVRGRFDLLEDAKEQRRKDELEFYGKFACPMPLVTKDTLV